MSQEGAKDENIARRQGHILPRLGLLPFLGEAVVLIVFYVPANAQGYQVSEDILDSLSLSSFFGESSPPPTSHATH
jgi:hypothetical protein